MNNKLIPVAKVLPPGLPSERTPVIAGTAPTMTAFPHKPSRGRFLMLVFLILAVLIAGGQIAIFLKMRQREEWLSASFAAREIKREREINALRASVDRLLRASQEQTSQIALLAATSREPALVQPPAPAPLAHPSRPPAVWMVAATAAHPLESEAAKGPVRAEIPAIAPSAVPQPGSETPAPGKKVLAATDTTNLEPPRKPGNRVVKLLSNPIVIEGAVLASSVLVPPSLPLTLAQSRLGRSLARRVLRKTNTDKTVGGRAVTGVLNMPITKKRKR